MILPARLLTEPELRQLIVLDRQAVDTIEQAFAKLAEGGVAMPPILRLDIADANGEVDVKTAYLPGLDGFAIKISPGFFDNPKQGLPSTSGLMIVLDSKTGMVRALLLDNGYLTDVRTAAAGGVVARHLAPSEVTTVGVIGAGMQARLQLQAVALERPIERALVWARARDKAETYAGEMTTLLGFPVTVASSPEALVRNSALVVTTTPAASPLIEADWLHPGLHITAMGSDAEHKNELSPAVIAKADQFVCDSRAQSARLGELHHALASGSVGEDFAVSELGGVVLKTAPGRHDDMMITVCDLTGTGVQDTAIAMDALGRAEATGGGTIIQP